MFAFLVFVGVCIHAILAYFAYCIWRELLNIQLVLQRMERPPSVRRDTLTVTTDKAAPIPVYAVWVYKDRRWELDPRSVPPGYVAGSAPSFSGSYENQKVKTECRRL